MKKNECNCSKEQGTVNCPVHKKKQNENYWFDKDDEENQDGE